MRLVGGPTFRKEELLHRIDSFATRAFRRPVSADELKSKSGGMLPSSRRLSQLSRKSYTEYYALNLQPEMKQETQLFFRHVLDNNLPARDLLSANYSFLNRDLAKLYGVETQTLEFCKI